MVLEHTDLQKPEKQITSAKAPSGLVPLDMAPLTGKTKPLKYSNNDANNNNNPNNILEGAAIRTTCSTTPCKQQLNEVFLLGKDGTEGGEWEKAYNEELQNQACHGGDDQQMIPLKPPSPLLAPALGAAENTKGGSSPRTVRWGHVCLVLKPLGRKVHEKPVSGKTLVGAQPARKKI